MADDTSVETENIIYDMIKKKTMEEKAKMGFSMFESSRRIVISTIKEKENIKIELFLRFYGDDFDAISKQKIINKILEI